MVLRTLFLWLIFMALAFSTGCTLYQSDARKALQDGRVPVDPPTLFATGDDWQCYSQKNPPLFFSNPQLETPPYQLQDETYRSWIDTKNSWLAISKLDSSATFYMTCEYTLSNSLDIKKTLDHGFQQIESQFALIR